MPYPASGDLLAITLQNVHDAIKALRRFAQQVADDCAAGNVPSTRIQDTYVQLKGWRAQLVAAAGVPGIVAYAQEQKSNPALDVVAEFSSMITAIDNVTGNIESTFPKDANGFLLAKTFANAGTPAGTFVDRLFAASALTGLRTLLLALVATIS